MAGWMWFLIGFGCGAVAAFVISYVVMQVLYQKIIDGIYG
jgi:hypothetical protein